MFNTAPVDVRLFSNSKAAQNISKFTLGQIPSLKIDGLHFQHLVSVAKFSHEKAKAEIHRLYRDIAKMFWKIALASVNAAADCGVNMFVLGQGIRRVYPRIPFVKGDEPAQKVHCTFYNSSNASFQCPLCLTPANSNPAEFHPNINVFCNAVKWKKILSR